jgi:hypothetical protein
MDQLIVVFLLFVAVLAFAWFYLQRAKARTANTTTVDTTPTDTDASRTTSPEA